MLPLTRNEFNMSDMDFSMAYLLESMSMNGKYKVKYFWARNMFIGA